MCWTAAKAEVARKSLAERHAGSIPASGTNIGSRLCSRRSGFLVLAVPLEPPIPRDERLQHVRDQRRRISTASP
jgi:hypothetical protein